MPKPTRIDGRMKSSARLIVATISRHRRAPSEEDRVAAVEPFGMNGTDYRPSLAMQGESVIFRWPGSLIGTAVHA